MNLPNLFHCKQHRSLFSTTRNHDLTYITFLEVMNSILCSTYLLDINYHLIYSNSQIEFLCEIKGSLLTIESIYFKLGEPMR